MNRLKRIPKFKSEEQERRFWQNHDSTEYVDYSKLEKWTFPNLKLTSKPVTIRIPETIIEKVKIRANKNKCRMESLPGSEATGRRSLRRTD